MATTGIFPSGASAIFPSGGGPGLNSSVQYAGPEGSDSNDGLTWQSAKRTGYAAAQKLINENGGGTLFLAEGFDWGGPVAGQGIWIRGDGLEVPGFLTNPPIRIIGVGATNGGVFMPGVNSTMAGGDGSGSRTLPFIWLVNCASQPVTIENISCPRAGADFRSLCPVRIGHDFDRAVDGSRIALDVTNATRTGTETVLTVDIDATAGWATGVAERTDDVVTLTIPNPGVSWIPLIGGVPFRLTSSNPDFPSGDYVCNSINTAVGNTDIPLWTITYDDAGDDKPEASVTGTVKTHGCQARELIEFFSNDPDNFVATMYLCLDSTIDTITVQDNLITGDANVDDVGTMSRLEMDKAGTTTTTLRNVSAPIDQVYYAGPGIMIGRNYAIAPTLENCYAEGLIGVPVVAAANRDDLRMAQVLAYAANTFEPQFNTATGFNMYFHTGTYGPVVGYGRNGLGDFTFIRGTIEYPVETEAQNLALPGLRIIGGPYTKVRVHDLQTPDSFGSGAKSVELINCPRSSAYITETGPNPILGECVGGDNWWAPGAYGPGSDIASPWTLGHATVWADGRAAHKHPGVARAAGPMSARFKNIAAAPGSWVLNGSTRTLNTSDVIAPDGSQTATKIVGGGSNIQIFPTGATGDTWEVGGKFVVAGWVWGLTNLSLADNDFVQVISVGNTMSPTSRSAPFAGPGWQPINMVFEVTSVGDSTPDVVVAMGVGAQTMYLWGMTCYYVDAAITDNDAFEHAGVAQPQPRYLVKGQAGTYDGQKFIGHGGIGTDAGNAKTVGVGSGQLTLTGSGTVYLPTYDEDGTTIIGWVAQLQATVNP